MKIKFNTLFITIVFGICLFAGYNVSYSQYTQNMMDTNSYKSEFSIVSYIGHHNNLCGGVMLNYGAFGLGYSTSGNNDFCIDAFGYAYLTRENRNLRVYFNFGYFGGNKDNVGFSYGAGLQDNLSPHFKLGLGWHSGWGWMAHIGYVF